MKEVDYDPATMKRATHSDITRIWRKLWGGVATLYLLGQFEQEDGEYLDRTQYNYDSRVGGGVSHEFHKLAQSVATAEPATNEVNAYDLETESERHEGIRKSDAEADRGRDE